MMRRNLLIYLLPIIAQALASFGMVAILTRVFSDADYGRFTLVFTTTTIAHYLTLTWVEAAAARFYGTADSNGDKPDHFATLLVSFGLSGVVYIVLAIGFLLWWPADGAMTLALATGASVIIFRSLVTVALETRRMAQQAKQFALGEAIYTLLTFALGIVFVTALSMGPEGPFVAMTLAALVVIALEGPNLLASAKGGQASLSRAATYFRYGAPLSAGLLLHILLSSGDRYVIGAYLGEGAVGVYAAGYQVASRVLEMIFSWANMAVTPLLIAAYERGGEAEARRVAPFGYALRLGVGAPAAVGIAMLAQPICAILIGEALRDRAAEIAPWIAAAALLAGMSAYFSDAFMLAKKTVLQTVLLLCPVAVNLALNVVLLPVLGLRGAIIASVIAYGLTALLLAVVGRRFVKLPIPLLVSCKIVLACAIMAGVLVVLPEFEGVFGLLYQVVLGALTYVICAYLLNIADIRAHVQTALIKFKLRAVET
ncbi:MAG: hypothetical protein RL186_1340 [Pseudomonadota bacterium]